MSASEPLSFARLHERGVALGRLLDAGVRVDRLARLDRLVRRGFYTDWPGQRSPGVRGTGAVPEPEPPGPAARSG
jgi:hypothetical protein